MNLILTLILTLNLFESVEDSDSDSLPGLSPRAASDSDAASGRGSDLI